MGAKLGDWGGGRYPHLERALSKWAYKNSFVDSIRDQPPKTLFAPDPKRSGSLDLRHFCLSSCPDPKSVRGGWGRILGGQGGASESVRPLEK